MQRRRIQLKSFGHNLRSVFAPLYCCLRGFPLFLAGTPGTPLRVLCIMAFDTLHVYLKASPMPRHTRRVLAAFLDFGACENAVIDGKQYSRFEYEANEQLLQNSGSGPLLRNYMIQLRSLEKIRPLPGGDHRRFEDVKAYREAVAKLSLETIAVIVFETGNSCGGAAGDGGSHKAGSGGRSELYRDCIELEMLFRIVMQCQIIDDVMDYSRDAAARLPSFLTATADLQQSIRYAGQAARKYETVDGLPLVAATMTLRLALFGMSNLAKAVLIVRQWQHRAFGSVRFPVVGKPVRR